MYEDFTFFMISCSSSPAEGGNKRTKTSTILATAISDWPTPTVSIIIFLYPAEPASTAAS